MTTKPFDPILHQKNDPKAKEITILYFSKRFKSARENPDRYGPDVIVEDNTGREFFVETEIKTSWNRDKFPFETLNIPKRKEKFLKYPRILFVVISRNLDKALVFKGSDLKKEYLKEIENKYISEGEQFYQIPINLCKIISI